MTYYLQNRWPHPSEMNMVVQGKVCGVMLVGEWRLRNGSDYKHSLIDACIFLGKLTPDENLPWYKSSYQFSGVQSQLE